MSKHYRFSGLYAIINAKKIGLIFSQLTYFMVQKLTELFQIRWNLFNFFEQKKRLRVVIKAFFKIMKFNPDKPGLTKKGREKGRVWIEI